MPRETAPVSVIVPAYNAEATVGRALESIARQTLLPTEIIVVDDGSADGTTDAARAMTGALDPAHLIVVTQANAGAGAARNRAIAEATQPCLAFLDADDEWLPEKLARSMQVLEDGGFTLVAHDYLDATPQGDVHVDCVRRFNEGADPYVTLYLKGYIPSISVVTRRDAVIAAGGFDETLRNAQDFDLWLKLLGDPGATFTLFGEPLARYHHSEGSIMSHTDRRIACCRQIALRYLPSLAARGASPIANLCKRLAIVYAEAARAQPSRKAGFMLRAAAAVANDTLSFLSGGVPPRETARMVTVSAAWVFGLLAVYLAQFRHLAGSILHALGIGG